MRHLRILVLFLTLAAGVCTPPALVSVTDLKNAVTIGHRAKISMGEFMAHFYEPQVNIITKFSCEFLSAQRCKWAGGELDVQQGTCTVYAPRVTPHSFMHVALGAEAIGNHAKGEQFALNQASEHLKAYPQAIEELKAFQKEGAHFDFNIGTRVLRVITEAWDIVKDKDTNADRALYVNCTDCRPPPGTVELERNVHGMCMSEKAIKRLVTEAFTKKDGVMLKVYMNEDDWENCFKPYIAKFLQNDKFRAFFQMSTKTTKPDLIEPWLGALDAFTQLSDGDHPVFQAMRTLLDEAATTSGVCFDLRMHEVEKKRLNWWTDKHPQTYGPNFSGKIALISCGSDKMDVSACPDPKGTMSLINVATVDSNTSKAKAGFSVHNHCRWMQGIFDYVWSSTVYIFDILCSNVAEVCLVFFAAILFVRYGNLFSREPEFWAVCRDKCLKCVPVAWRHSKITTLYKGAEVVSNRKGKKSRKELLTEAQGLFG